MLLSEYQDFVVAMPFVADSYTGNRSSQVFSMRNDHVCIAVEEGAGGVGTATITLLACSDFVPTATQAIPFRYRLMTSANNSDTLGAVQNATASGYLTVAGAHKQILIEVDARELPSGKPNLQVVFTAGAAGACVGGAVAVFSGQRYGQNVPNTVLS